MNYVDVDKVSDASPFTPEMARRAVIAMRKLQLAGEYGYRVVCLADRTGDARLIAAATRYADDHALGISGVRGESRSGAGAVDYLSNPGAYGDARLSALTRLRRANEALGTSSTLVHLACVECLSACAIARRIKVSDKTATSRVLAALNRLADHYESRQ